MKTIQIADTDHTALTNAADQYGMKLYATVGAWARGWQMLSPEQQAQAIRINVDDAPLGSAADGGAVDPRREGLRLGCDATHLNVALNEMLADGEIDKGEKNRLRDFLRKIIRRAENIDRASSRKSRKGRAA